MIAISYALGRTLFDSYEDWLRGIAEAFLYAGGLNNSARVLATLDHCAPAALAKECIDDWWDEGNPNTPHARDLTEAFAKLAGNRDWLEG